MLPRLPILLVAHAAAIAIGTIVAAGPAAAAAAAAAAAVLLYCVVLLLHCCTAAALLLLLLLLLLMLSFSTRLLHTTGIRCAKRLESKNYECSGHLQLPMVLAPAKWMNLHSIQNGLLVIS